MRIVCDLLSTIMPPMPDLLEDCCRFDCLSPLRSPAPMAYTVPSVNANLKL
ncbi:MAG: hypothetical protein K2O45_05175 [Oscillospiraceae bacterium]|nr:hypothetical protein [Oscillospiraceae bacterium]